MSAGTDGGVHYDVTRIGLINALRYLPLTKDMHLWALGRLADSVLAVLPASSDAAFYMEGVKAERERLAAEFDRQAADTSAEADAHAANGDGEAELMAAGASDTWRAAASRARLSARHQEPQP